MTKAVRNRVLTDVNGDIGDHLRNHIHLTNCIHLKNHMHKQSPILADRALMRDLIVLQRSRSLRDPSASPRSWNSPSIVDMLQKKGEIDGVIHQGRRSVGSERRKEGRRLSSSSLLSKVSPEGHNGVMEVGDRISEGGSRRVKREESSRRSNRDVDPLGTGLQDFVCGNSDSRDRSCRKHNSHGVQVKHLSEHLNEVALDSDDVVSSNVHVPGRNIKLEKTGDGHEPNFRGGLNRGKRRKFRGAARRTGAAAPSVTRDVGGKSELSVASNSFVPAPKYRTKDDVEEYEEHNVTRAPGNGCGIPFNWSRIHHRGKNFLDIAGRSLSCGLSESRLRKGASNGRIMQDMPVESDGSSSFSGSDAEALPLLVEASGSQNSTSKAGWVHDYSGELGIYVDHLLKHEVDSDLSSEARSRDQPTLRGSHNLRHQSLTQKYMPRTFRDLIGQNLVVQALSNAIVKRKIGLLYVFYGPHGTGKTSCARMFARALNCHSVENPKPCGFCSSCVSHETGKSQNIREVGPVGNFDFESIMDLLENMFVSQSPTQYRVFIFDECDTLSPECWSAILKVIERAPRRLVFILVCSSLDVLPHVIISRCQKFFFPKLKDADIIYTLQWIASKEDVEIDKDALKLIASRSDGSLRDAEMTLEQLSLLGQRISVPLVQELVGLISDEKLVDLLDLALSADTVNTVKNLRVIMETGVEPLALMSQLATVITDILAGSYDFAKVGPRRKFFKRQALSKGDMEKLRQALKTLSEAEKQLRMSNDKLTWLTAALLQLAPDQQYMLPSSSADTSFNHSPLPLNNGRDTSRRVNESANMPCNRRNMPTSSKPENHRVGSSRDCSENDRRHSGQGVAPMGANMQILGKAELGAEAIWYEVLKKIQINDIKDFLYQEGKLVSVSFGAAPTMQLMFSSQLAKSTAEKFSGHILQAFELVVGSPVTIEIRCETKKDARTEYHEPLSLPAIKDGSSENPPAPSNRDVNMGKSEIVEIPASPVRPKGNEYGNDFKPHRRGFEQASIGDKVGSDRKVTGGVTPGRRKVGELSHNKSIVRSKVSLAHVIQQVEGRSQGNGWSKRKAVSIAEKLEQENLRLESRSRNLFCWKAPTVNRRKVSRLKIRNRRPHAMLKKLVCCGKCLSSKSSR